MIEKKILIFGLFVLFLLPASVLAADDDSSPESTIVFRETLPDDIMFYPDNETHGTGYAESFADVSDWSEGASFDAGSSFLSDGDVLSFHDHYGGGEYDFIYTNSPSLTDFSGYIEVQHSANDTGAPVYGVRIYLWTQDDAAGSSTYKELDIVDSWTTERFYVSEQDIESIAIRTRGTSARRIDFDYLRIASADELGWQHDGSTTAGIDYNVNAEWTSDGARLNISNIAEGSYYARFDLYGLDLDYYSFLKVNLTGRGSNTVSIGAKGLDAGASYVTVQGYATLSPGVYCYNLVGAGVADYDSGVRLYMRGGATGWSEYDWIKLYSIANFTVTQSGAGVDDYLYVEDGILYSHIDDGYIELDHDPTLSVVPDTYPLYYNLITTGITPEFSLYVFSWSTYSDEIRGIISSRIVSDIKLKFDSTEVISEIMFAMDDMSILVELFLSTDMWGYLGPFALVLIGYVLTKKEKILGVLWFVVECLFVSQYLALVEAMPDYWWHIFILLIGGLCTCVFPLWDR